MIRRRRYLARSTKPIPRKRAQPRRGPLRCPEYRAWLRENMWCVIGVIEGSEGCRPQLGELDAAHTENNGMRSKGPDSSCAPLCRKHHREYDAGRADFERIHKIDMQAIAAGFWLLWQKEKVN